MLGAAACPEVPLPTVSVPTLTGDRERDRQTESLTEQLSAKCFTNFNNIEFESSLRGVQQGYQSAQGSRLQQSPLAKCNHSNAVKQKQTMEYLVITRLMNLPGHTHTHTMGTQ